MTRLPGSAAVLLLAGSLAVAGVSGTLEERMRDTPAAGRVLAKTGTLRGVSCYAGFVKRDGRWQMVVAQSTPLLDQGIEV